jgi:hypothetical protein
VLFVKFLFGHVKSDFKPTAVAPLLKWEKIDPIHPNQIHHFDTTTTTHFSQ